MTDARIPRGELAPGQQLFVNAVESLVRHTSQQTEDQELVGELLTAVQDYINDPRTELPDDKRLLANLGVLGVALLNRR